MKVSFEELKRKIYILSVVFFVIVAGLIYLIRVNGRSIGRETVDAVETAKPGRTFGPEENAAYEKQHEHDRVIVHVCGAVNYPGVYELESSDRIGDAVQAAGGFTKKAAKDYTNLAQTICDGEKIVIYTRKQVKKLSEGQQSFFKSDEVHIQDSSLLNINSASEGELMSLPGIGESKAKAIISYRDKNGPFKNINDLMNISGIKDGILSKIADMITI